jgi:hypothetical protein
MNEEHEYGLSQQQNKINQQKSKRRFKGIEYWIRKETARKRRRKKNKKEEHKLTKKEECMNIRIFKKSFCQR